MSRLIDWCFKNRYLVLVLVFVLLGAGLWSLSRLKLDAIPDISDTQVIIELRYPGQPPQVVEDQVTYPVTTRMMSVPGSKDVRGFSFFGFSLVYILFEEGTELYWARARVLEYMNSLQATLPEGVRLELGPDATSTGWIFQYALRDRTGKRNLADLRDLQDFYLRYELLSLEGVSEVAPVGGYRRQFQVEVNPTLLYQYGIRPGEVARALRAGNQERGARLIEQAETEYMVLARGYLRSTRDIEKIPLRTGKEGNTLTIGNIATVREGPDIRRGLAEMDGEGEVVGGIVVMRHGEDVTAVAKRVRQRLDKLRSTLPTGVEIITTYDRSGLIFRAVSNLSWKLAQELLVVGAVIFIFLSRVRSVLVAVVTLPLGVLFSLLMLSWLGVTANIMSLGGLAIAIGVMVDASVVMVENAHKLLEGRQVDRHEHWRLVRRAALEVGPGLFWSLLIIILSFLPVFALPGQSGKMFTPLAITKTLAMVSAVLLAVAVIPVLMGFLIGGRIAPEEDNRYLRKINEYYKWALTKILEHPRRVIINCGILLVLTLVPVFGIPNPWSNQPLVKGIGSEFMPPLKEGDLLYMPTTIPGISITKARDILTKTDRLIKSVPEVKMVFGKIGRADTATDPAPLSMIETTILLKDRSQWRDGMTMNKIIAELDEKVRLPGVVNAWTMPVKARIDMLSTGIKTPVGIKIMGPDLARLQQLAGHLEKEIGKLPNVSSVFADRARGGNYITYNIDRDRAARYGLNIGDIQDVLSIALGGRQVTEIIQGQNRWSANLRYQRGYREGVEELNNIFIPLPGGGQIPVAEVLEGGGVRVEKGPALIKTENGRKTAWLYVDSRSPDIGGLVDSIEGRLENLIGEGQLNWPEGYSYLISGQYEQMELANDRLMIIIPLVLTAIIVVLYFYFRGFFEPLLVMGTSLLVAPLGGIWALYLFDYQRSVASDVGFITLLGLAAETGVLMLVYLGIEFRKIRDDSLAEQRAALMRGAVARLRPKLMTTVTTFLALLPLFWGDEPGNTAMRRIALPVVGGLLTDTFATLFLIPLVYEWWHNRRSNRMATAGLSLRFNHREN